MRTPIVIAILIVLLSFTVSATSEELKVYSTPYSPVILDAYLTPLKVVPGDMMHFSVTALDTSGVRSVYAEVEHDKGHDVLIFKPASGNPKAATYKANWLVHDTRDPLWYDVRIFVVNNYGETSVVLLEYQDPVVSHPAAHITSGIFPSGTYEFQGNVGFGTSPSNPLHVEATSDLAIRIEEDGAGSEAWVIGVDNSGDLNFFNDGDTSNPVWEIRDSDETIIEECPSGFSSVENAGEQMGCIQNTEEGTDDWDDANQDCWNTYGGRLPFGAEWQAASVELSLTAEHDDFEWEADSHANANVHGLIGSGNRESQSESVDSVSQAYRCWLPR